jgi:hypothetical protein
MAIAYHPDHPEWGYVTRRFAFGPLTPQWLDDVKTPLSKFLYRAGQILHLIRYEHHYPPFPEPADLAAYTDAINASVWALAHVTRTPQWPGQDHSADVEDRN